MKIRSFIFIGAAALVFVSCLKSKDSLGLVNDSGSIVTEIADVNTAGSVKLISFLPGAPLSETTTAVTLKLYAPRSNKPKGGSVHVTLVKDDNLLGANYEPLPISDYSIPSLEYDIPADAGFINVPITVNKTNLDPAITYGIGLKIASVSDGVISDLAKSIVVAVGIRNKFDGIYKSNGFGYLGTTNTTAPYLFSTDCDWGLELTTSGANTVDMSAQPLYRNGAIIYFNGIFPRLVFDLTSNKVTNVTGGAPGNAYNYTFPDPSAPALYDSRYDEAAKKIYVRFRVINAGWYVIDTLTYCGPR